MLKNNLGDILSEWIRSRVCNCFERVNDISPLAVIKTLNHSLSLSTLK